MRILVVNVNTTAAMTAGIARAARDAASAGTEIIGLTPTFGAESCEGNVESHLAALGVMDAVLGYAGEYDAVIQAGYGEHGREALQELLDVPVVDITEAGAQLAMMLGRRYSVVTTLDRTVPLIEDRLLLAGLDRHCASVRASGMPVLDLEAHPDRAVTAIAEAAADAVGTDRAEAIVLGCGGMADLAEVIEQHCAVPVVDGVAAAVRLAEALVGLGLTTSKVRTYAPARPKRLDGWPFAARAGASPATPETVTRHDSAVRAS
ncbi:MULTISPECIES: aspartate/glutamate racemase family protein [unclassified Brevibacterium]|uniref:aspartate/glutamate racemase family protein n=1 Tax=unclassified Brevibacterium TaxID=2614124 RepID=UPI0010F910D7|nr:MULTISPECIES: aspartate/glutamate racemase family protein [unclassified Brevibacterium]MCM1014055.1 aspartate/glutamate racemase family protein [Brevibacterium sp. XM4083]